MTTLQELEKIIAQQRETIATLQKENKHLLFHSSQLEKKEKEIFLLRELIALMPGNIFWKDKNETLQGCNNHLAKILNLNHPSEIIGKRTSDLINKELAEHVEKIDRDIMKSVQAICTEEEGINTKNEPAIYLSHKIPIKDKNGEVLGIFGTALDITEHKKLEKELKIAKEKAEASNRAKSQFLAVVNHELRIPLTGILGLVDFLKRGNLSTHAEKEIIEDLENCAKNLLSLVNDVLNFSRLEAGRYQINKNVLINFPTLIDEVLSITTSLAKNKGLALRTSIDPQIKKDILTDPHLLRQILINIVNNAIKFTDHGFVEINIRLLKQDSTKVKLEIAIRDTGHGIPADKINVIFEPFQQLEDPYTRSSSRSGTGLGLAIVRRMAALLNINLHVVSEIGNGSTFYLIGEFELSTFKTQANKKNKKIANDRVTHKGQKPKVLLIEDDQIVQRVHKRMLIEMDCEVDITPNGYDALKILNNHDLIFVDLGLPDITGFEVIKAIRENNDTAKKRIPIVALTGYTGEEEKIACLNAGANEVASKPITANNLKEILARYTRI